jgi:hypothetical protein
MQEFKGAMKEKFGCLGPCAGRTTYTKALLSAGGNARICHNGMFLVTNLVIVWFSKHCTMQ